MASNDDKVHPGSGQETEVGVSHHEHRNIVPLTEEARQGVIRIDLGWRSWLVVFITCFAIMAQVFVVVAAGSVIAFIIRDLGSPSLAGWVIQGPLLMQSVLSPIVGRLSDVLNRKYLASLPPLIAFAGAVVSAKATSMSMLIGGGILIGTTLSTIAIVQAIPSEILPLKYRALANGFAYMGGAIGGLLGVLASGALTNIDAGGWRYIFWLQAAFHLMTSLGLLLFYWPGEHTEYPKMALRDYVWACDPVGSFLFLCSTTLMLLALDWASGDYAWSSATVAAPLTIGIVLLVLFFIYEWKGRADGLVAHVFFDDNLNFLLSVFAFAVEGWIFYSAFNSITPQLILNLGFEDNAWSISVRQLSTQLPTLLTSIPITLYATRFKDLKSPLLVTFTLFLVVTICYATIQPSWNRAQIAFNVLAGMGQSGPLTLLVACIQFTAPHAYLSTATGLAFSARAIGGAFGSAVLNAIINGRLSTQYAPAVTAAATGAGLPESSVAQLLESLSSGQLDDSIVGATPQVWSAALDASRWEYAHAYRLAWASIIPFVVLAIAAIAYLKGVKDLMTEKVEATVEHVKKEEKAVVA
ncbi:putative Major facilitator superfamily (MFS) profile domain-containing protein [Seiridium cardinale]|uniref:Major facilitator superfamily (MFS) profile domain-containing protein n=1 Tax=Seiridium cardinale TaxID=138064 RepID=A0ABR2XPV5_9PEZI